MNVPSASRTTTAQAVVRAGHVLLSFAGESAVQSPAEVAKATGINRTTAYRLLLSLEAAGLVRRDPKGFALTPAVLRLGEAFLAPLADLESVAEPVLVRLRDETEETSALHIRDGFTRVVIRQVESQHELRRHYPDIGTPLPLHLGAPSMAILASMTDAEVAEYCTVAPVLFPDGPPVSAQMDLLTIVRARGYAVSHGQRSSGVSSVASAIFNSTSNVVGAINVSGPTVRFSEASVRQFGLMVRESAAQLSARLGYDAGDCARLTRSRSREVAGGA